MTMDVQQPAGDDECSVKPAGDDDGCVEGAQEFMMAAYYAGDIVCGPAAAAADRSLKVGGRRTQLVE